MRKLLSLLVAGFLIVGPVFGADNWDPTQPAGSASPSDIDTLMATNNESLERALHLLRDDMIVVASDAASVNVLAGTIAIGNSAGTVYRWRETTSTTNVTWANIDTGAEDNGQYYLYAVADTADSATCTYVISASSTSPSGCTYYRKIGYFRNVSGDITNVGNLASGNVNNIVSVSGTDDITTTSTSYDDMDDMVIYGVFSGKSVLVLFEAPVTGSTAGIDIFVTLDISGTDKIIRLIDSGESYPTSGTMIGAAWVEDLSAGEHTITAQWKVTSGTAYQQGSTNGARKLTVIEF